MIVPAPVHYVPSSGGIHEDMPDVRARRMTDDPARVTCETCLGLMSNPCIAPQPLVDFSGRLYGAHDIARNLGSTCPYCRVTFEFWGDATPTRDIPSGETAP